jgi:hypothetical protein
MIRKPKPELMSKKTVILCGLILFKFVLQWFLISPEYDLQRDEYLYLDQSNHLAWGYASVPPMTAWISHIIKALGNGVFWVKFFPSLFGALTILMVWKTIEELKGNLFAMILGSVCILFSVILRLNTLYQPNSLDVLCWTALYFAVIKYADTEKQKWLFFGAIVFAIGFLNKYNIVFLLAGLFPAILLTPQRKMFTDRKVYFAILLGLLLILPNLLWQYNNGFPVVHHLKELADTQLVNVDRFGFLRSQLLFFIGSLFVILSGLYALLFYPPFKKFRFFFWSLIFTLAVFLYFKAKDYYAIGLYPIYLAFGSVLLGNVLQNGWKRYLRPVAIAIPILIFIPMIDLVFPIKSPGYIVKNQQKFKNLGMLRWEDGKDHQIPQDFADMLGWKELAMKVDNALPANGHTLVLCDNYGQAGAINYYTKKNIKAVSFNADYINWFDLTRRYDNVIRVKDFKSRDGELAETSPYFQTSLVADSIANPFAREYGTTIFRFTGAKVDVSEKVREEMESIKSGK